MQLTEAREYVARFNAGASTPEESAAFLGWLNAASRDELTIIADTHEAMQGSWAHHFGPSDEWVMQLERKLDRSSGGQEGASGESAEAGVGLQAIERRERESGWNRWMLAASVVVLLSAGLYLFRPQARKVTGEPEGRRKSLSITLSNPLGSDQRTFVLPDGSKVILNAGSALKYPPGFAGDDRLVELSGDAFFDVKGSAKSPFRVLVRDGEVEALGTYFEVMAYDDEPESRTTLVNGVVRVTSGPRSEVLKPGEQAEITYPTPGVGAGLKVHFGIDTKAVLDWRDGIYDANGAGLKSVLRVLARRYNLAVQYQANVPNPPISGDFDLHKNLDALVQALSTSLTKDIHIKLKVKTLTVTSN